MSAYDDVQQIKRAIESVAEKVSEEVSRSSLRAYKVKVTTAPYVGEDGKYYCGVTRIGEAKELTVLCSPRMKNVSVDTINWVLVIFSNWRNAILWQSYDFSTDDGGDAVRDVQKNGQSIVSNGVANILVDDEPTSGSSHLITSGGVYTALGNYVTLTTYQTISGEKIFTAEVRRKNTAYAYSETPSSNSWKPITFSDKNNTSFADISAGIGNSFNAIEIGVYAKNGTFKNVRLRLDGTSSLSAASFMPGSIGDIDLGTSYAPWRTGYFGTQVRITSTADVGGTTDSTERAPLLIGTPTGVHLEFDANEIIAKGSANTTGELSIQTEGGRTTLGNALNWTELDTKRADLMVKGQIYDYGANCSRGVDASTNYAGYFKLAEAVIPNWYRGPKARIEISNCDSVPAATLVINGYLFDAGSSSSSQITLETSNFLGTWQNRFFLVVRQDKTVRAANKVFELWYYAPSGTSYSRIFASFRYDVADTRAGDPVASKWNKFTRTSAVDQGYVSAGVVDLTNGFIPVGSFTASTFATTTYPDCEIYNDTAALQDRLSYLQIRNEQSSYSDRPSTATSKHIDFIGRDFVSIADINTTVGESWNALNFNIKTKNNATHRIEFVSYPSTDNLHFDCLTDAKCNLGNTTRRWKNIYLSGSLNDGTIGVTATNIIKSVCVCETSGATAAKVVTIPNYTLRSGNMISIYFINANTATQPTLNINGTGAIPIYYDNSRDTATTALTAGWHTFFYSGTGYYVGNQLYGLTVSYATGAYELRQSVNILAGEAIKANRLIGARDDNKYYMLGAGKQISTLQPIMFASSAISANVAGSNNWIMRNNTAANMFNNGSSLTVTSYAPIFLVGTLNGHIFTTNSGTWWTQTIPTTEDGFQYMLIGYAYSTTQVRLFSEHPIYEYVGGAFRQNNIIPSDLLTQSNISTTFPISSSAASDSKVLSEKAVADYVYNGLSYRLYDTITLSQYDALDYYIDGGVYIMLLDENMSICEYQSGTSITYTAIANSSGTLSTIQLTSSLARSYNQIVELRLIEIGGNATRGVFINKLRRYNSSYVQLTDFTGQLYMPYESAGSRRCMRFVNSSARTVTAKIYKLQ